VFDKIIQMRDEALAKDGKQSNVQKYFDAYSKYQKDLASVGVTPTKEQMFGRPYKA